MSCFPAKLFCVLSCLASILCVSNVVAEENNSAASKDGWIVVSNDLNAFQKPIKKWSVVASAHMDSKHKKTLVAEPGEGAIVNGNTWTESSDLLTKRHFGDVEVSLEFLIPKDSNSGVKLNGMYEVQIRDTYKDKKLTGDECGGIYPTTADHEVHQFPQNPYWLDKGIAPLVNAAKAPGEWQSMDIVFHAPRFDAKGKKIANAKFERVTLNGQLVQKDVEVRHATGWRWHEKEVATGPLLLQGDHGPVVFRNVRIRPLDKQAK